MRIKTRSGHCRRRGCADPSTAASSARSVLTHRIKPSPPGSFSLLPYRVSRARTREGGCERYIGLSSQPLCRITCFALQQQRCLGCASSSSVNHARADNAR